MTDISESGIEAALLPCPVCGKQPRESSSGLYHEFTCYHQYGDPDDDIGGVWVTARCDTREQAIAAWNRRHPSREEGLREAADIAFDFAEAASSNAERLGQPSVWESAARTTARDIASAILALIPTKPEAKEPELETLRAALRYARPLLVKYAYTQGNSADFVREITAPVDAALQSKKPE